EQIKGRNWTQFIHPGDRDAYLKIFDDALAQQKTFETKYRLRHKDGEYRWMKSTGKPRFSDTGEFVGFVGASFDIQDLKEAEESLRHADENKNHFLAMLAHELRNPLAPLRNVIEMLKEPMTETQLVKAQE